MNRHQFELPLGSGIDRGMTIVQYGHYGRPVLVFPSEAGRAWDFENNGMLDAIGNLINDGRVKLYCVDTLDADTWADKGAADRGAGAATRGLHPLADPPCCAAYPFRHFPRRRADHARLQPRRLPRGALLHAAGRSGATGHRAVRQLRRQHLGLVG